MEGTRPLLVEIQALVAPTTLGTPRRAVVGWDPSRLSMVLAVLEAHCGVRLGQHDVYLNVAGGLRITSRRPTSPPRRRWSPRSTGAPLPPERVYFGEIGAVGRGAAGGPGGRAAEGSGQARLSPARWCPDAGLASAGEAAQSDVEPSWRSLADLRRPDRGPARRRRRGADSGAQ